MDPIHIAELLKWPAIVLGTVGGVWLFAHLLIRKFEKGAVSKDDLAELQQLEKDKQDAERNYHAALERLRDRYRRVRNDPRGGGPAA